MSERPFPPSARRRALARRAGVTASSPMLVGAFALAAVALVLALGRGVAGRLADAVASACDGRASLTGGDVAIAVLGLAAPVLVTAAVVAVTSHLVQTRAIWLPRRRVDGAPAVDAGPGMRTRNAAIELGSTAALGAAVLAWLWWMAPRLAALVELEPVSALRAVAALIDSALGMFAIAWLALGMLDAIVRHIDVARALAMTPTEKREDERLAAADPRWARERALLGRTSLEGATVLILGDDAAAAIAWEARRRPVPMRVAVGQRAYATQLLGLARRHGVPVHRDVELAAALVGAEGPVPGAHWHALATIIAAVRR